MISTEDTLDEEKKVITDEGTFIIRIHFFLGKCSQIILDFPDDQPLGYRIYGFISVDKNKLITVYNTDFITFDVNNGNPIEVKSIIEMYMLLAKYKMNIPTKALDAFKTELLNHFGFTI